MASASKEAAAPAPPTDKTAVRLTVLDAAGKDDPVYDFGPAPAGPPVTHVFTLRNDAKASVVLDRVSASCNCTSAIILDDFHGGLPRIPPGATARIRVTLDTSGFPPDNAGTLEGSRVEKDVSIFVADQPVHAAAVLQLTGRLTRGVAFDRPFLNLGAVDEARGTSLLVRVTYDPGVYSPENTRLSAPSDSRLTVESQPDDLQTAGAAPVRKTYRVTIPPHAAIGPLSGLLTLTGTVGASASGPAPATLSLPYTGAVRGRVAAEPGLIVFGMISRRDPYGKPIPPAEAQKRRVRWILLVNPSFAPSAKGRARLTALTNALPGPTPVTGKTAPMFWRQARVQVNSPFFHTVLVPPVTKTVAAPANAQAAPDQIPPDISAAHLPAGSFSWLRVVLLPSAPHGQPISGQATVHFPDGEQILLPVQAEVQ